MEKQISSLKNKIAKYYDKESSENRVKFTNSILSQIRENSRLYIMLLIKQLKQQAFLSSQKDIKKTAFSPVFRAKRTYVHRQKNICSFAKSVNFVGEVS